MKTILLSLTAAAALAATVAPAAAQPYGAYQGYGYQQREDYAARSYARPYDTRYVTDELNRLDRRVSEAVYAHRISWEEARDLKGELRAARPLAWRVRNGQASPWERRRLENTEARIESALNRYAENDRYDWRR